MRKNIIFRALIFSCGLILWLDGTILLLYKKIHLDTLLPFIIGMLLCSYALFYPRIRGLLNQHQTLQKICKLFWIGFLIWLLSFAGFAYYLKQNISNPTYIPEVKAIIILGSAVENGQPSAALAARLDTAAPIARQQPDSLVVVTGGIDFGENESEAVVMSRYLQQKHQLPADRILLEDKSTSTELNLKNSTPILEHHHIQQSDAIAIVTNDFHTLRAQAIANKQGYSKVTVIAAPTPLSIRFNAWLREYFAFLSGWILGEY